MTFETYINGSVCGSTTLIGMVATHCFILLKMTLALPSRCSLIQFDSNNTSNEVIIIIFIFKVQYPMYIEVRVQWTISPMHLQEQ